MKKKFLLSFLMITMAAGLSACLDDEEYDESYYDGGYEDYAYSETGESGDNSQEDDSYLDEYQYYLNSQENPQEFYDYPDDYQYYDESSSNNTYFPYDGSHGTAKELSGNIAIISLFVSDKTTSWDLENADSELYSRIYSNLNIATDYLEKNCKEYGKDVNFIYDWTEHPELFYSFSVDVDYSTLDEDSNFDYKVCDAIDANVPTASILEKVNAEQAIYMMYFNTPGTNSTTSCTRVYYEGAPRPYEVCYMLCTCMNTVDCPACFAHEILHTFGAPDLYYAGMSNITQEYIDQIKDSGLNDIMRITSDPNTYQYVYDDITNEITDITAYYVGLTDHSDTVTEWGFAPSEHDK